MLEAFAIHTHSNIHPLTAAVRRVWTWSDDSRLSALWVGLGMSPPPPPQVYTLVKVQEVHGAYLITEDIEVFEQVSYVLTTRVVAELREMKDGERAVLHSALETVNDFSALCEMLFGTLWCGKILNNRRDVPPWCWPQK